MRQQTLVRLARIIANLVPTQKNSLTEKSKYVLVFKGYKIIIIVALPCILVSSEFFAKNCTLY
jgi:hypothetical protein